MSSFAVLVTADPAQQPQSHLSALAFCHALLDGGHSLSQVFFYNDGVRAAATPDDEPSRSLTQRWQSLGERSELTLTACVSAAERRGIKNGTLLPGFELAGLGQLADATLRADRTITFAG